MPLGAVEHQVQCQYGDSASERFSEPHREATCCPGPFL